MDLPSSHQAPRGPVTRARARALETEVTSLLNDISYDPLETWLLPQSGMLCMIRYQEDPPEDAHEDEQDPKSKEERNQRKKAKAASRPRTSGPWRSTRPAPAEEDYSDRTSGIQPGHPASHQKSGVPPGYPDTASQMLRRWPRQPGHPAPPEAPDIRHLQPEHPAPHEPPDIRPDARTSGAPCLRAATLGRDPCIPSPL